MNGRVYDIEEFFLFLEECLLENVCEGFFLFWFFFFEFFFLCRVFRIFFIKGLLIVCVFVGKKSLNNNIIEEFDK